MKTIIFVHVCGAAAVRQRKTYVGTIDLRVIYDANNINDFYPDRKPNVRFGHNKCKTEVRFLRASHIANGNPSLLNRIVHDSYDLHVKCLFVLRCTLSNFNGNFNATISQGVTTGKINRARTITKHIYVRPVVIEALGKNFPLSLLLIRIIISFVSYEIFKLCINFKTGKSMSWVQTKIVTVYVTFRRIICT